MSGALAFRKKTTKPRAVCGMRPTLVAIPHCWNQRTFVAKDAISEMDLHRTFRGQIIAGDRIRFAR